LVDVFGWQVRWAVGNHRAQLAIGDSAAIAVVQGEISAGSSIDHVTVRVADVWSRSTGWPADATTAAAQRPRRVARENT
jgi:hypothetical protein